MLRFLSSLAFLITTLSAITYAEGQNGTQFKADKYTRDLETDTVIAKGNAWLKKADWQIWADEIEIDFSKDIATARGAVHMRQGKLDIWGSYASQNLGGDDILIENATIVSGKVVVSGKVIKRTNKDNFHITEGSYTNCNITKPDTPNVSTCDFAWEIHGKSFDLTIGSYAHVYDAIVYLKNIPIAYTPYLIAPVKSKRQTGILRGALTGDTVRGSGFNLPVFIALGDWHDLTIDPTYYGRTGYKLGLDYRYIYDTGKEGRFKFFGTQRYFSANRANPGAFIAKDDPTGLTPNHKHLRLLGEWALDFNNIYKLGKRSHARFVLKGVSHEYYPYAYKEDLEVDPSLPSLRSQLSATFPYDHTLFTADIRHHQNLIVSRDQGVDQGAVTKLPSLGFFHTTKSLLGRTLAFEFDSNLTNYFRPTKGYDPVPSESVTLAGVAQNTIDVTSGLHNSGIDTSSYKQGDYIRTGRRLHLEPRLITTIPMPSGLELQPVLKFGTLFYHFDYSDKRLFARTYAEAEIPFSMYLSKTYDTPLFGYEKLKHILQPRVVYGLRYNDKTIPHHDFFYDDAYDLPNPSSDFDYFGQFPNRGIGLSNPRFDLLDRLTPFNFARLELINRFYGKRGKTVSRFFLFQLSNQINFRTATADPRFEKRYGPIELLASFNIWRFRGQIQGTYDLETAGNEHDEYTLSSSLDYSAPGGDSLKLGNRISRNNDVNKKQNLLNFSFVKNLPVIFDLSGSISYSLLRKEIRDFSVTASFASKPVSCWKIALRVGQTGQGEQRRGFTSFSFKLDFGDPSAKY